MTERRSEQPAKSAAKRVMGAVALEVVDRRGALRQLLTALRERSGRTFAFCNMHTFNVALQSPAVVAALAQATVFNDGVGIDIASRILFGEPFPDNLNGTDLTAQLLALLDRPTSLFLIGSAPGIAEQAGEQLERKFPQVKTVGAHHGFFTPDEGDQLVDRIRDAKPDLVLLGMGNPRQELWAAEIRGRTDALIMCVGAYLDYASGSIRRAPRFIRSLRIEWLYRLVSEPIRLSRR
ncbi:MAG TPA: WecB/TagA/CpsF family glycosyltransferase, partial [Burkholderiaceae bacterium]